MNPYLQIPVSLPGDPEKSNGDKEVPRRILPQHVIAYHRGYSFGTFIYLTTGQAFLCTWTVEEYEAAIRAYWKEIEKAATKGKLKLLQ